MGAVSSWWSSPPPPREEDKSVSAVLDPWMDGLEHATWPVSNNDLLLFSLRLRRQLTSFFKTPFGADSVALTSGRLTKVFARLRANLDKVFSSDRYWATAKSISSKGKDDIEQASKLAALMMLTAAICFKEAVEQELGSTTRDEDAQLQSMVAANSIV